MAGSGETIPNVYCCALFTIQLKKYLNRNHQFIMFWGSQDIGRMGFWFVPSSQGGIITKSSSRRMLYIL